MGWTASRIGWAVGLTTSGVAIVLAFADQSLPGWARWLVIGLVIIGLISCALIAKRGQDLRTPILEQQRSGRALRERGLTYDKKDESKAPPDLAEDVDRWITTTSQVLGARPYQPDDAVEFERSGARLGWSAFGYDVSPGSHARKKLVNRIEAHLDGLQEIIKRYR